MTIDNNVNHILNELYNTEIEYIAEKLDVMLDDKQFLYFADHPDIYNSKNDDIYDYKICLDRFNIQNVSVSDILKHICDIKLHPNICKIILDVVLGWIVLRFIGYLTTHNIDIRKDVSDVLEKEVKKGEGAILDCLSLTDEDIHNMSTEQELTVNFLNYLCDGGNNEIQEEKV